MPGNTSLRNAKLPALIFLVLSCALPVRAQQSTQQSIQAIGAQAEEMEREGHWNEAAEV